MHLPFSPEHLDAALQDGYSVKNVKLVHRPVGDLLLPSGRLVACDPFVRPDPTPFSVQLPRGRFPVILSIAQIATDERVAFAFIRLGQGDPMHWDLLTVGDQDLSTLKEGEIFGYPVDSGTGCFMDFNASRLLAEAMTKTPDYYETLTAEMDRTYRHTWSWLDKPLGDSNLVAFSSGYGDGVYATYRGSNSHGAPIVIVTDFAVLPAERGADAPSSRGNVPKKSGLRKFWESLRRG